MRLQDYHIVYFVGIGGIGMSALARWFVRSGFKVAGYDRTPSTVTLALAEEGVDIHFDDTIDAIPSSVKKDKKRALIVTTPAIPQDHQGLNYLKNEGFSCYKRSEVLGIIATQFYLIAVAGTHGKTTTSSIIAHLLKSANRNVTAFLGGITTNYKSNYIFNNNKSEKPIAVVEADEFDRSFLTLHPDIAVVTSTDADHLDIYGDKKNLEASFQAFINQIKSSGKLFINEKIADDFEDDPEGYISCTYGLHHGQLCADNISINDACFEFDYTDGKNHIKQLKLSVPGFHNVENATAAIGVALAIGLTTEEIKAGISSYQGVKRRFEYVIKSDKTIFVDDYAHHPAEITAFLKSLKALYPKKKVTAIFQPHLYTRTRDFPHDFAKSLDLADEVILLDIYPAREQPIPGVTAEIIFDKINASKISIKKEQLIDHLKKNDYEVIATLGAGDIDQLVTPIKEHLNEKYYA